MIVLVTWEMEKNTVNKKTNVLKNKLIISKCDRFIFLCNRFPNCQIQKILLFLQSIFINNRMDLVFLFVLFWMCWNDFNENYKCNVKRSASKSSSDDLEMCVKMFEWLYLRAHIYKWNSASMHFVYMYMFSECVKFLQSKPFCLTFKLQACVCRL